MGKDKRKKRGKERNSFCAGMATMSTFATWFCRMRIEKKNLCFVFCLNFVPAFYRVNTAAPYIARRPAMHHRPALFALD